VRHFLDISGRRYGRLVAVRPIRVQSGGTEWLFRCDCGNELIAKANNAKSGNTSSCGCQVRENNPRKFTRDERQSNP
jgi:hypothetical protein